MAAKKVPAKKSGSPEIEIVADQRSGVLAMAGMPPRVWVSCGLTINRGNYESARVDAGMAMDVPSGESVKDAFEKCWNASEHEIRRQFQAIRSEYPANKG